MTKRVLLAVDLASLSPRAASHAVHLAARLKFSLMVMGVAPASGGQAAKPDVYLADLPEDRRQWLAQVMEQGRREGVNPEIFLASGPFLAEVLSFARSQPAIQFIIMGLPPVGSRPNRPKSYSALSRLHNLFEGEVLLVPEKGQVLRLAEHLHPPNQGRET